MKRRESGIVQLMMCKRCGVEQLTVAFYKNRRRVNGYQSECKKCSKERSREHYRSHTEETREYNRAYYRSNAQKLKAAQRANYWSHIKEKNNEKNR